MKTLSLIIGLVLIASAGFSQRHKGYVYIGPSALQNFKGGEIMYGGSAGFQVYAGIMSGGFGLDVFTANASGVTMPMYADIRVNILKKSNSPFILIEPGYNIKTNNYKKAQLTVTKRGGIYGAAGLGFVSLVKKVGFVFTGKAALMRSQVNTKSTYTNKNETVQYGVITINFAITL